MNMAVLEHDIQKEKEDDGLAALQEKNGGTGNLGAKVKEQGQHASGDD